MRLPVIRRSLILLAAWAVGLGQAASPPYPPASVQITVRDEAGKPVAGASVRIRRTEAGQKTSDSVVKKTDADGRVEWSRASPVESRAWMEEATIEKPGTMSRVRRVALFTGAQIQQSVTLEAERQTVITVIGPDGQPAAGLPISTAGESRDPMELVDLGWPLAHHTDERGAYLWRHGALPKGFDVSVAAHLEHLPDGAAVTVKLTAEEMTVAAARKVHTIRGRLLLADGSPAGGWLIAQEPPTNGIWMSFGAQLMGTMSLWKLIPVERDGSFQAQTGSLLVAVSPEGVPVPFDLNPAIWAEGAHHVTITLPPERRKLEGQIVALDGKPMAGLALHVGRLSTAGATWSVNVIPSETERLAAMGIRLGVTTDAEGRYSIPVPVGVWPVVAPDDAGWTLDVSGPVQKIRRVIAARAEDPNAPPLKDIAVRFVDEAGAAMDPPAVSAKYFVGNAESAPAYSTVTPALIDVRGLHFFVSPMAERLEISAAGDGWNGFTKSIPLAGGDGQVTVTLESALRWKAAKGRIVDAAGNGVADVTVYPFTRARHDDGRSLRVTRTPARTDAQGRFEFTGLPDACELQFTRFDATGNSQNLPGWAEPAVITPAGRDVEIHLRPAGSIRIILPENLARDPGQIYLEKLNSDANDFMASAYLVADRATHSLVARRVVPGTYKFNYNLVPELGDLTDKRFDVKEGRETVADWSKVALSQMDQVPEGIAAVNVLADGKPVSGAQVTVFSERWPDEVVAKWIKEWSETDATTRAALEKKIISGAGNARQLLEAMRGDEATATAGLRDALQPSGGWRPDSLVQVMRDLSDDQGAVRFKGQPGRQYVAVAQCPGRWLGWQQFVLGADGKIPPIAMKPTRPLEAPLPPWSGASPGWDPREFHVSLTDPGGIERRALMRVLGPTLGGMDAIGIGDIQVQADLSGRWARPNVRVIEDLPVGAMCEARMTGAGSAPELQAVRIGEGAGPLVFKPVP